MDQHAADIDAVKAANQRFYDAFGALDIQMMDDLWDTTASALCVHPGWEPIVGWETIRSQLGRHLRQHHADALQHPLRQRGRAWRRWMGDLR